MNSHTPPIFTRLLVRLWRAPLPGWLRALAMWLANPWFLATASALVLNDCGEVLLFHHTYRRHNPWGLPGGFLQRNEDPAAAARREIMEEAGLEVRILRPLWVGIGPGPRSIDTVFLAGPVGGSFQPSPEVSEAAYFPPEALPPLSPGTRQFILRLVEEANRNSS